MQSPNKIEDFAGQRILAMDPRAEKVTRACVACGSTNAQKIGVKNELEIVSCCDCHTVYELLEHIFEPRALLQEVARILRPGGLFWTTTPHARGISARLLGLEWRCIWPPEHLQLFSVRGLKALLREAGFREIHVDTTGGNPVEIWHALGRTKSAPKTVDQHFDRVLTSYQLNESLMKKRSRRALKSTVNSFLNLSRLGDSMKVFAVR